MPTEPWRYRCPESHTSWVRRGTSYYCKRCNEYFGELVDAKTGETKRVGT